jgi:hypothetical protein
MARTFYPFTWLLFLLASAGFAQPAKPKLGSQPRVCVVAPLGAPAGATTRLTIRGLKLDAVTEVRFPETKATVKIIKAGAAPVPNQQPADKVGNTQVEVDVTLPADMPEGVVPFEVFTPGGTMAPHRLLVTRPGAVVKENEPNGGFRQAQPLTIPGAVDGVIAQNQDVDVYRFQGKAGQKLVIEVLAARYGSALDSFLTLYDERGATLASNDDVVGTDSRLQVTLPRDGTYYIGVIDANDQGGPAHVYRLVVRPQ